MQTSYVLWLVGEVIHQIRGLGPYGDLGLPYGHRGGSKIAKKGTKKHTKGENEKNNQICKQHPVFQFVGEVIHEIIGTVPLGDPGGTLSLRRGLKLDPK